jgi:glutamate carboxypeptidase
MMEETLRTFFEENLPRYLNIFQQMVTTNSFTANPAGVNKLGDFTASQFAPLGFKIEKVQSSNPDFGKHLVLTRKGSTAKKIGLITHLDTVFPPHEEIANNFTWRVEGDRIYGPGTNDIKGGTIMILMLIEAMARFYAPTFDAVNWVVLANAAEERWSSDFGHLCRQHLGPEGIAALVFEAGYLENSQASLVTARKGMAVYDIRVEGKSAHAGNGHQSGASAIVQMADLIQRISTLTDYNKDLTFNVGVINAGTVPNRVPHSAEARGEMRTFSKTVFNQALSNLMDLKNIDPLVSWDGNFACNIDIEIILKNNPWPRNPETEALFELWQSTAQTMGMNVIREERGGLSDGNQIWDYIPTIDGLGPNGRNAHCSERSEDGSKDQEFVTISSMIPKAMLNTLAIQRLISQA